MLLDFGGMRESSFNVSHTLMQTKEFRHLKNNFQIGTNKYQLC